MVEQEKIRGNLWNIEANVQNEATGKHARTGDGFAYDWLRK